MFLQIRTDDDVLLLCEVKDLENFDPDNECDMEILMDEIRDSTIGDKHVCDSKKEE